MHHNGSGGQTSEPSFFELIILLCKMYENPAIPFSSEISTLFSMIESVRAERTSATAQKAAGIDERMDKQLHLYYSRVYQAIAAYTSGTGLDPSDLTQETFLKAYKYKHTFEGASSVYTWLYRIARNTCIDAMRKIKRNVGTIIDTPYDESLFEDGSINPDVDQRESNLLLKKALAKLDDELRILIVMKDLQGLQYDEIAEATEQREGTVKSRLFRARLQLKKELIKLGYTP